MYRQPPGRSRRVVLAAALTLGLVAPAAAVAVAAPDGAAGTAPAAADGDHAGYFFPYFTGESTADGETVSFAVSNGPDPLDWTTLNDDAPVLTSDLGTEGLRDPFVIRKADGSGFVVLATDLKIHGGGNFGDAQETGSRSIMIWESPDLVNWSEQREVVLAPENAGNLWAPEAFYDADAGEYVVYWASALYPDDVAPSDRDIRTSYQRMLYATTTDFVTFSEPRVWIDERRGDGLGMIDSTIAEEDGVYHRLTKDESYMGMRQESSTDLRLTQGVSDGDGWDLTAERIGFGEPNPWGGEFTGGEGPTMFPSLTDDRWFLLQDQPSYHGGQGYMLFETDDLGSGEWRANLDAELPASPRHGSVIPITAEERDGLLAAYPPASPAVTEHTLTIDADAPRTEMSDDLYGVFYEDINYAADGGLYAELVRNRSFEFAPTDNASFTGMTAWDVVEGAGGTVEVASERDEWLNDSNRAYLQIEADGPGVGVRNEGYNSGFAIEKGGRYDFSMFVRSDARQRLTVSLESADGTTTYAEKTIRVNDRDRWREVRTKLRANATVDDARLVVTGGAAGTLRLDMVSLFPRDTWVGPVNGRSVLREDLAQLVADLEPSFLRFPGGCVTNVGTFDTYLESDGQDRRRTYQWKETIGPVEERPTNWNFWGYNQSYGLGYLEYFEFAEDLGATPLPVLSVGANGCGSQIPEMTDDERIDRWVQDTVDLIEFANGDVDTEWGAVRAELGHPEPFGLEYIGLGNEENTRTFEANFPRFRDAIEERYPDVTVISNSGPDDAGARFDELWAFNREQGVEMVDEHYYNDPAWFLANDDRYDSYDRNGPHVFLGEYASRGNQWRNALAEAAYMTGIERNSDLVELASYAPMFANEDYVQWSPDMMWFDNDESWGSTSYWTQQMFMTNTGDEVVASEHTGPEATPPPLSGGVFLSTWLTQAAYDDVVVTDNETGDVLFWDDFSGEETWDGQAGTWDVVDGEYVQSAAGVEDARSIIPDAYGQDWSDYTLELSARKLGGGEGFLVGFAAGAPDRFYWWNLGGWGNSRQALERADGGRQGEVAAVEGHSLETGRDYDLKVVVSGRTIEMYLDGELQMTYTEPVTQSLYQVVTTDDETGDLLVKVVNPGGDIARTDVAVAGFEVAGQAEVIEMSGDPAAVNTKTRPERVVPTERTWTLPDDAGPGGFTYDFPPHSITFLRLTEN
ncbi:alpha-L-arabinofuranosidase C-terminal domain-containing protein [Myceligenerans salitolerans]|uniref:non-reducing end alpha-L-arabinofuranosidase n=1 Tax=Myceligenerans salitolerans TaxID=1230528 RepID=A0ABS3I7N7_9MICO|nr:alpha-L-arabinofuranosidase C-terminal domain-containing protein [Myceligenerans salitolerans]MBO0608945.1 carbohydrate binding domain-containing protein [Myceligenerans salitolerans]